MGTFVMLAFYGCNTAEQDIKVTNVTLMPESGPVDVFAIVHNDGPRDYKRVKVISHYSIKITTSLEPHPRRRSG
jgi:hypothetical protein